MASIQDLHILIVDDNESMQKAVASALGTLGFKNISVTSDLLAGWKAICRQKVGLVLCEAILGDKYGIHLLKKVRSTPQLANLPFLIMSARNERRVIDAHMKAGASEFLPKPFDAKILLAKLKTGLTKKPVVAAKAPAPAQKSTATQSQKLVDMGFAALDDFDVKKALACFSQAAKTDPKNPQALKGLAYAFKQQKDIKQFMVFMGAASKIMVEQGSEDEAGKMFEEMKLHDEQAPNPFAAVGLAAKEKANFKEAVRLLKRAVSLEPENSKIHFTLGETLMLSGETDSATTHVEKALSLQDDFPEARKVYKAITGNKWTDNEGSDAQKKRKKQGPSSSGEKEGTVRFWAPDLLLGIKGHAEHMAITHMSMGHVAFNPMDESFKVGEKLKFDILRLGELGAKPEIKSIRATVSEITEEEVEAALSELTSEQELEIAKIMEAAQKRQKEKYKEDNKAISFDIDMLFM